MTKSTVKAAVRRVANRRIERQYDPVQQQRARAYHQHQRVRDPSRKQYRQGLASRVRRVLSNLRRWISGFGLGKTLRGLDLRNAGAARFGPFDPDRRRNVGAAYLRDIFGQNLKMVSTRDGRKV